MENLTQKWTQSGHSLQNQGTFFSIFKIREASPRPPPSCAPSLEWFVEGQVAQLLANG